MSEQRTIEKLLPIVYHKMITSYPLLPLPLPLGAMPPSLWSFGGELRNADWNIICDGGMLVCRVDMGGTRALGGGTRELVSRLPCCENRALGLLLLFKC